MDYGAKGANMLKQRREAADQVAAGLFEAEAAIDAALNKAAALAATMPVARTDAGLSALFGQDAVERISETINALTQARRGIIETHKELAEVRVQIGLGATMTGVDGTKPAQAAPAEASVRLVPNRTAA